MALLPPAWIAAFACTLALCGEGDRDRLVVQRHAFAAKASQRHLEYGVQLRREGLCVQAAAEIVLAVEVGAGRNAGATFVLGLMRDLDDRFWKKNAPRPTRGKVDAYAKQAQKLVLQDRKERFEIASWAWSRELWEDAHAEFAQLLAERAEPLAFDGSGRVVLDCGTLPAKESERLRDESIEVNGARYVRDAFLTLVPQVRGIFERSTPELRVRSTTSLAEAEELHALALQLLPVLEADFGARPARRMELVLLHDVAHYEAYLDAVGMPENKAASGLSDRERGLALVCTGKSKPEQLPGLCLHELTHEFHYAISRSTMPSWYDEGVAESYGGQGAFTADAGKLVVGLPLEKVRLDAVRAAKASLGLRELLHGSAIALLNADALRARTFYAQSWALVRFLRTGAGDDVARRFAQWETTCRGGLAGAEIAGVAAGSKAAANERFLATFEKDLAKLEDGFWAWLAQQ